MAQIRSTRLEHDLLGDREVPNEALYGVHTLRALENFPISGIAISQYGGLVRALAEIKLAAVQTNAELGLIDPKRTKAIAAACAEIIDGKHHEHFVVDVIQGSAGTSSNMNANEVIANRALEILGSEGATITVFILTSTSTSVRAPTTCIRLPSSLRCSSTSTNC